MIDIVDRLRFDAARCAATFSKGVAGNITEAADEIEQLRFDISDADAQLDAFGQMSPNQFRKEIASLVKALVTARKWIIAPPGSGFAEDFKSDLAEIDAAVSRFPAVVGSPPDA